MDEQATQSNAPEATADLGPGPVTAPIPPYDPGKFSNFFWLFISFYIGAFALSWTGLGAVLIIPGIVFWAMFLYAAWNQIQDGHQRTSAGLAVGLMFIPLWWFYWQFVAFHGLAKSINEYQVRWNTSNTPVNEGLALTSCILVCTVVIPILGWIAAIVGFIMMLMVMNQIRHASTAIAQARLEGVGHPAP